MISFPEIKTIGFTGTQKGLSYRQIQAITEIVRQLPAHVTVHHGDCVGADEQFDALCRIVNLEIYIHPPTKNIKRAFCEDRGPSVVLPPEDYLNRNKTIVRAADVLIAAPYEDDEQLRSGTWSTLRYAIQLNKPHVIVYR